MLMKRKSAITIVCLLLAGAIARGEQQKSESPKTLQGFSVVLLLGEKETPPPPPPPPPTASRPLPQSAPPIPPPPPAPSEELSAQARKALADIKDFLPYKNYRVLDSQWVAADSNPLVVTVRLHGLSNQEYEFGLSGKRVPNAAGPSVGLDAQVQVALRTPSLSDAARGQAVARLAQLEDRVKSGRNIAEAQREMATLRQAISGGQTLLDTSLKVGVGETVVVGTSRIQGDKALVVVLTAVSR